MAIDLGGFVKKKTVVEIGTEKFSFTELTIADLCEFRADLNRKREAYNDKRRKRLLEDAEKIGGVDAMELLKFVDKPITEEEAEAEMETTDGLGLLAYLSLRHHHIGISREQALGILLPSKMEDITAAMFPKPKDVSKKKPKAKKLSGQQQ